MSVSKHFRKFNEGLAVRIVVMVATMECVYAFAAFVMVPFFLPSTENIVQYVSSSLLQLVFLPLIMVGQDVMSRKERAQRDADHRMIIDELKLLREIHSTVIKGVNADV